MKITRSMVETETRILEADVKQHKHQIENNSIVFTHSKEGLLDFSIFVLANLQLLSPDFTINKDDVLFKKIAIIQKEIRELKR